MAGEIHGPIHPRGYDTIILKPMKMPDTHPEAERIQIEILRQMPVWRRIELLEGRSLADRSLLLVLLEGAFQTPRQRKYTAAWQP